ncbi:MAG TPA: pantoate--beta-alanine ligase [Ktedonobacter sp.]|nr:pantoate--beta-alanine ligase [Ktedonobacter sp.]
MRVILSRDLQLLGSANVDVVFIPRTEEIYPAGFSTYVIPSSSLWAIQPTRGIGSRVYNRGVATIITKLFQLVRPDVAYFGQKNAHQVAIIRQLIRDLNIDVSLRILPIVRESDGLAMGSRNYIFTPAERQAASVVYRALLVGKAFIDGDVRDSTEVEKAMKDLLATEPLVILDYVKVCHAETLSALDSIIPGTMLMIAVHIGKVHLVDNIIWRGGANWHL